MSSPQKVSFIFWFSVLVVVAAAAGNHHQAPKKLFVFGDSYADTGNGAKSLGGPWKEPYGTTFPGKPTGRYSDGRVFTDFLARWLGLKTPAAYRWRMYSPKRLRYGLNFAFGGTGVFDTPTPYPNMTTQIDFFQHLLEAHAFSPKDLDNSVALVTLSGNDYAAYLAKGGTIEGLPSFITQVVTQLVLNIERIYSFGVKKIAVTELEPIGCLPRNTITTSFQQCNSTFNKAVAFHNLLLQQGVAKINNQTQDHSSPILLLDLYDAFFSVLQQRGLDSAGSTTSFNSPLKPCCMGVNQNSSCGSVDAMGNKLYTVCQDPNSAFFWDSVHPTQAGWHAVTQALQPSLQQLRST